MVSFWNVMIVYILERCYNKDNILRNERDFCVKL